ncbi:MAG TPA: hypothetical protein DCX07_12010 [Phycisphaerales bacterium]|nr:hypothetical protein [Phycisphaerales bacterium]
MIAWQLFLNPMMLPSGLVLYLVIPLCVSVAVVYKTVRAPSLRRLWIEIPFAVVYMLAGLAALAVALFLIQEYCL